jgi:hypothetical protein
MKTITICGKEYEIEGNAFTYIQHRKIFNKGFFEDLRIMKDYLTTQSVAAMDLKQKFPKDNDSEILLKLSEVMNPKIDEFIEAITRIAYILIYTANDKIMPYDDFLKSITNFKIDDKWIIEVTEFAVDCFC